ncbi:unnamed protein product [Staurois parvus]|uniref:Uncharacterized protein n=1 Tax=Staurois parvus TaxID=386267 RepID=A0ABN9DPR1_9NEOB|nr:unnamed protein product [Staurois parvus]
MLNLVCMARKFFFSLGRGGHVISTAQGQSALSKQKVRGYAAS